MKLTLRREYTTREKAMLVALVVVVVATLLVQFVYMPMFRARIELDQRIVELENAHQLARLQAAKESEIDAELARINARLEQLTGQLPQAADIPQYLIQVEQAALSSGVRVKELKIGSPVNKKDHGEIPISIVASGEYSSVVGFLRQIETAPRYTNIIQWRLVSSTLIEGVPPVQQQGTSSLESSRPQIDIDITVVIYVDSKALTDPQPDQLPADYSGGKTNPF